MLINYISLRCSVIFEDMGNYKQIIDEHLSYVTSLWQHLAKPEEQRANDTIKFIEYMGPSWADTADVFPITTMKDDKYQVEWELDNDELLWALIDDEGLTIYHEKPNGATYWKKLGTVDEFIDKFEVEKEILWES